MRKVLSRLIVFFSLFASSSTLLCCALPVVFVTLGAGATFAGIIGFFPWLVLLSEHKSLLFLVAGCLLFLSKFIRGIDVRDECLPGQGELCESVQKKTNVVWQASLIIYILGFFFAFVLPALA